MVPVGILNYSITFFCLIGLGLSIYAFVVELQIENNENHIAMCDISEHISCTKAFKSEYGKGFGLVPKGSLFHVPNSLLGIVFYCLTATFSQCNVAIITKLCYWLIILSNITSVYFAYILYFKLYDFCIVCVSTYVVNFLCLILTHLKLRQVVTDARIEASKKTT